MLESTTDAIMSLRRSGMSALQKERIIWQKKKVFISFDYENDKRYYYIMKAWDVNSNFEFCFSDYTSREIQSDSVDVVKRALSRKIGEVTYPLVIIGKEANKRHKNAALIGYRNWQNYEVAKSVERGNGLIGVKIDSEK